MEFIRFEAEIENYGSMETVLAKLDMKTIKLSGFTELLKIRAAEAKPVFPSRYVLFLISIVFWLTELMI